MKHDKQVTLAITGASGAPYALTLLKSLVNADYQVYVLISSAAKVVFATEENVKIPGLSSIHLENMLKLSQMGATIMPAAPGFYHNPKTIDDLVDFVVARILDHLGIEQSLVARWGYQSSKHSED